MMEILRNPWDGYTSYILMFMILLSRIIISGTGGEGENLG